MQNTSYETLPFSNGPLARYVKLRDAHAPGMPETFSPPPRVSDADMHHGKCVTNVPWCMPGSLTSVFLWSRWCWKRSGHSRCMRNPQIYVSGKRPMWYRVHYVTFRMKQIPLIAWFMGPIWGRQDPGVPHVGPMNFAIWDHAPFRNALVFLMCVWLFAKTSLW